MAERSACVGTPRLQRTPVPPSHEPHQPHGEAAPPDFMCAAACGSLGRFGNCVFQYVVTALLAQRAGLRLCVPEAARLHLWFASAAQLERLEDDAVFALPLVADRCGPARRPAHRGKLWKLWRVPR
jgi:hypothetical protein